MTIELNELETRRFGIIAAKVSDTTASPETIDAAARSQNVQMLSTRVEVGDITRVHALESAGYQLMDTLVYYRRLLDDLPTPPSQDRDVLLRSATRRDATAVAGVARSAFRDYFGHYHADPNLDRSASDAAYVDWAERCVLEAREEAPVLLAERDGQVAGFVAMRWNNPSEIEIVLNGVESGSHGRGLYSNMIAACLQNSRDAGADCIITSTQINNYSVQRAWSRFGFCHYRSLYTFHKWFV